MGQRKPHWLCLRRPAPIWKPNPMSSHSACSSREFCMTCAAPRDKGRMGCCCPDGEAGGVGLVGGYKKVGGNGWRVRVWLWGKGRRRDILRPLCACVGESHHPPTLPPSDTDLFVGFILKTPALWRWPPETNPVTSSALKWPLVDMARTVCHSKLPVERWWCVRVVNICASARWGAGVCLLGKWGIACTQQDEYGWSLMLESSRRLWICCLHDTRLRFMFLASSLLRFLWSRRTGIPISPQWHYYFDCFTLLSGLYETTERELWVT